MLHFMIVLLPQLKPFMDKKMFMFEEYGAFKWCIKYYKEKGPIAKTITAYLYSLTTAFHV